MSRRRPKGPDLTGRTTKWWVKVVCTDRGAPRHGRIVLDEYVVELIPLAARPRFPRSTKPPTGWVNGKPAAWGAAAPGNDATLVLGCPKCGRTPQWTPENMTKIEDALARTWSQKTRQGEIDVSYEAELQRLIA